MIARSPLEHEHTSMAGVNPDCMQRLNVLFLAGVNSILEILHLLESGLDLRQHSLSIAAAGLTDLLLLLVVLSQSTATNARLLRK